MPSGNAYAKRFRLPKYMRDPIARGVVGGLVGVHMMVSISALSVQIENYSLLLLPVVVVLCLLVGVLGVVVGGIPSAVFGIGIGISEKYKKVIPNRFLWLWYLLIPSIFSLMVAGMVSVFKIEWLILDIILLGLLYMPVRVFEIRILKKSVSPLIGALLTALLFYVLEYITLAVVGIDEPSGTCIIMFFVALFQRINGGLKDAPQSVSE